MIRKLQGWLAYRRRQAMFRSAEIDALRRGDSRAVGNVRAAKKAFVHAALEAGRCS